MPSACRLSQTLGLMSSVTEYVHLIPGVNLPKITKSSASRVVVIADADVTPVWQASVSDWLVQSGCLYMMAWGNGCSSWDDSVDMANLQQFEFNDIPEDRFVMTTWHTDEPLKEVFWYCKNNAFHPTVEIVRTVLLHIASSPRKSELLRAYAEA